MDYLPAVAIVAVIGGTWGWGWCRQRKFRIAVADAVARLNGRHEPGGRFSGGTLYGKVDGRDIVFIFDFSTSSRAETTTIVGCFRKPTAERLQLKGREAVARAPELERYSGRFAPVRLRVDSTSLSVVLYGVIRDGNRLVELATLVAGLSSRFDPG